MKRREFYQAISTMLEITNEPLLQDAFPHSAPHNVSARILRHGLVVSAFALLERNLRDTFENTISRISGSPLQFSSFPDMMQKFMLVDAISGVSNQLKFINDNSSKVSFALAQAIRVASAQSAPPIYTAFGFSPTGSNVGSEDLKKSFRALGAKDAWGKLDAIAQGIGSSTISLENDFKNISAARHHGAHDLSGNIPVTTLQSHLRSIQTIAITSEVLGLSVSKAILKCRKTSDFQTLPDVVTQHFRFLDSEIDGNFAERQINSSRVVRRYDSIDAALTAIAARVSNWGVMIRDTSQRPFEFVTADIK